MPRALPAWRRAPTILTPNTAYVSTEVELYTIFGIYLDTHKVAWEGELVAPQHPDDQGSSRQHSAL